MIYRILKNPSDVEEAWKALSSANMAEYLRYMYKTVSHKAGEGSNPWSFPSPNSGAACSIYETEAILGKAT